jgi:Raf kinase inhibitor-like YbhB/YbcL family protein
MKRMSLLVVTLLTVSVYMRTAADARGIWVSGGSANFTARISAASNAALPEGPMQLTSKMISPGGQFPKRETCDGQDMSPQLAWSGAPPATKSFALILDDPDAPGGTFTHWILFNISPTLTQLPESLDKNSPELTVGSQGSNDFGKIGYGGPCPPPGKPHRYFFRLHALDTVLSLKPGQPRRADIDRAIHGHVLAHAELMARYGR